MDKDKKFHIGTNVGANLHDRVVRVAREQDRAVSSLIRVALRKEVFRHEADKITKETRYGD